PALAKTAVRRPGVCAERDAAALESIPPTPPRLRCKPAVAHNVDARPSRVVAPGLDPREIIDRPVAQVYRAKKPVLLRALEHSTRGDRSTVTDAGTPSVSDSRLRRA